MKNDTAYLALLKNRPRPAGIRSGEVTPQYEIVTINGEKYHLYDKWYYTLEGEDGEKQTAVLLDYVIYDNGVATDVSDIRCDEYKVEFDMGDIGPDFKVSYFKDADAVTASGEQNHRLVILDRYDEVIDFREKPKSVQEHKYKISNYYLVLNLIDTDIQDALGKSITLVMANGSTSVYNETNLLVIQGNLWLNLGVGMELDDISSVKVGSDQVSFYGSYLVVLWTGSVYDRVRVYFEQNASGTEYRPIGISSNYYALVTAAYGKPTHYSFPELDTSIAQSVNLMPYQWIRTIVRSDDDDAEVISYDYDLDDYKEYYKISRSDSEDFDPCDPPVYSFQETVTECPDTSSVSASVFVAGRDGIVNLSILDDTKSDSYKHSLTRMNTCNTYKYTSFEENDIWEHPVLISSQPAGSDTQVSSLLTKLNSYAVAGKDIYGYLSGYEYFPLEHKIGAYTCGIFAFGWGFGCPWEGRYPVIKQRCWALERQVCSGLFKTADAPVVQSRHVIIERNFPYGDWNIGELFYDWWKDDDCILIESVFILDGREYAGGGVTSLVGEPWIMSPAPPAPGSTTWTPACPAEGECIKTYVLYADYTYCSTANCGGFEFKEKVKYAADEVTSGVIEGWTDNDIMEEYSFVKQPYELSIDERQCYNCKTESYYTIRDYFVEPVSDPYRREVLGIYRFPGVDDQGYTAQDRIEEILSEYFDDTSCPSGSNCKCYNRLPSGMGSWTMTLGTTNESNPRLDLSGVKVSSDYEEWTWELIETGYGLSYGSGVIDKDGNLVGLPSEFNSGYPYDGHMAIRINPPC